MRFLSTERLARASARRPWLVIGVWVALLIAGGYLASGIGDVLTQQFSFSSKPESARADDLLEARLRGPKQAQENVLISNPSLTVDDHAFRSQAEGVISDLRGLKDTVKDATSYYETSAPGLVSADKHTLLVPVNILGDYGEAADNVKPLLKVVDAANGQDGFQVLTAGEGSIANAFNQGSSKDAENGERIGIPVALIILLLVFGAAVAAGIPLLMAIASIVVAFGVAAIIGQV
jgi:RND superfamily putative drug exporter